MRDPRWVFFDLALAFDPATRRCDFALVPGPYGLTLKIDRTPATALLASLGVDRRALPDDELPDGTTEGSIQAGINPRRGWSGDALDADGDRAGSRLWLLERAKQTEDVRQAAEDYAREATQWISAREGVEVTCDATWVRTGVLAVTVHVGAVSLTVQRRVTG